MTVREVHMTYIEQVQSELQKTLDSTNTPKWAHAPLRMAASYETDMLEWSHMMVDLSLLQRATRGGQALEHLSKTGVFAPWMDEPIRILLRDGDKFDVAALHGEVDVVMDVFLARGTYIPNRAFAVLRDSFSKWTEEDAELVIRFKSNKIPDWANTVLQEVARIDFPHHQLLHLAADCDILAEIIHRERSVSIAEAWVQSDIPEWMRSALVEFRVAEDRWGRTRIKEIALLLIEIIATYYQRPR